MKQTDRKPDKTLRDEQKEQAGAIATFGQRNRTKSKCQSECLFWRILPLIFSDFF